MFPALRWSSPPASPVSVARRLAAVGAVLLLVCGGSPAAGDAVEPNPIRVGLFVVPGLASIDAKGRPAGVFGDLLVEMQRASGQRFELIAYSSVAQVLGALEQGQIDIGAPVPRTAERDRTLRFTETLSTVPAVVLGRADSASKAVALSDLAGKRVASMSRGLGHELLRSQQHPADVLVVETGADAVKAVAFGEADYAVLSLARAAHYVQTLGLRNLQIVGELPVSYEYAFAALRSLPDPVYERFAAALGQVDAGTRRDLFNRWMISFDKPLAKRVDLQLLGLALLVTLATSGVTVLGYRARLRGKDLALSQANLLLERTAKIAQVGGWSLDLGTRRLHWSKQTYAIYGCDPADFSPTSRNSVSFFTPESAERLRAAMLACMRRGVAFDEELQLQALLTDQPIWVRGTGEAERVGGRIVRVFGTLQNIDALKRQRLALEDSERRFRHQAGHDALTGLANRAALTQHVPEAIARADASGGSVAVLFLDADNFKHINDVRGHSAGDALLRQVAARLAAALGKAHFVARVGGDEFVVVIEGPDVRSGLDPMAAALIDAVATPVELADGPAYLTVSVGAAFYPSHGGNAEELLAAADTAMYAAKSAGKNTWKLYDASMGSAVTAKLIAQQNLRSAFDNDELTLHYQPKLSLTDGSVCGAEALLRWNSPDGVRGPAGFIQAAEDSGFIGPLGRWVIEQATCQVQAWRAEGLHVPVAVNVSAKQLQDAAFVPFLRELIRRDPMLPALLELEITESVLLSDADGVIELFAQLKALGLRLHIDDFGTGYSSLSYLSRIQVDSLKIDRSFVTDIPHSAQACGIALAVLAVAHSLGLDVVAEGVETPAQAAFLRDNRCEQAQGYLYSRAVPADQLAQFVRGRSAQPAAADAAA